MIACVCAWCNCCVLVKESHKVAVYDEETGELVGYEIVGDECYEFWYL